MCVLHGEKPFDEYSTCHIIHIHIYCPLLAVRFHFLMRFLNALLASLLLVFALPLVLSSQFLDTVYYMENTVLCWVEMHWCVVNDIIGQSVDSFLLNSIRLTNTLFTRCYRASLTDLELNSAISLLEVIFIREGHFTLPEFFDLSHAQLTLLMQLPHYSLRIQFVNWYIYVMMLITAFVLCVRINIIIIIKLRRVGEVNMICAQQIKW